MEAEPCSIALNILRDKFFYDDGKNGVYTLRNWRGTYYLWQDGRYIPISRETLENLVVSTVAYKTGMQEIKRYSSHAITAIMQIIRSQTAIPEQYELNTILDRELIDDSPNNYLCMENLTIYVKETSLGRWYTTPHSPRYFTMNILPYRYIEDAQCPQWLRFIETVTCGDKELQILLQQWAGYLLRNDLREQKFLLCYGSGANGKGVFTNILERMLGKDNCSHVPLHQFANPFALGTTLGKKLNSTSESSDEICKFSESMLKSFVAGDRMEFARKFKDPVRAVPTAKIMISTNELPKFGDPSTGLWRRLLLVPFNVTIPEEKQDKRLAENLECEMPGIFNWALHGVKLLTEHNGFIRPAVSVEAIKNYRRSVDHIRTFLEENFTSAENSTGLCVRRVYSLYRHWCENGGYSPINANQLGHRIQTMFPLVRKIRRRVGQRREHYYESLNIISDSELNSYGFGQDLMFF